jgi:aminoglycoside phosphotransferase (APT) family kinase protein
MISFSTAGVLCQIAAEETRLEKRDVTPEVAARLVASQFPEWAGLPVRPVKVDGWDNSTYRLGNELSIRLPTHEMYVPQIEKEHRWLPVLAHQLPLRIPEPVAKGSPEDSFPWPWSVYRWLSGETALFDRIGNLQAFASELSRFLAALYSIDSSGGPPAGAHNFYRGGPLATYDAESRDAIRLLEPEINGEAVAEVWEAALASTWNRPPVWVHGDVSPTNLLVREGRLRAVIDFGCAAVGDPACDLMIAWTLFVDKSSREVFRAGLQLDDETWARARGWALWKALITLAEEKRGGSRSDAATSRWGWRSSAKEVIDLVIAEHDT